MRIRDIWRRVPVNEVTGDDAEGSHGDGLQRVLSWPSLTVMGIAAIIGTGIFVLPGQAAALHAGPAVIISFALCGIVCAIVALCYAEFASMIKSSGSAFMYAYATLGEIVAWIIGWDLLLEYAFGASGVAVGWSAYFKSVVHNLFGPGHLVQSSTPVLWGAYTGIVLCVGASLWLKWALRNPADKKSETLNRVLQKWIQRPARMLGQLPGVRLVAQLTLVQALGQQLIRLLAFALQLEWALWLPRRIGQLPIMRSVVGLRLVRYPAKWVLDALPYVVGLVGIGLVGIPDRLSKAPESLPWEVLGTVVAAVALLLFIRSRLLPAVDEALAKNPDALHLNIARLLINWAPMATALAGISLFPSIDLPAMLVVVGVSALLVRGVHHTAKASTIFVIIKVAVIVVFIALGISHISPANWHPFIPDRVWLVPAHGEAHWAFGLPGIMTGAAIVLFAFIGFDGVTTAAGECKRPQRDVPIGILLSLFICTVAYVAMAVVMTGDMHYSLLAGDEATGAAPVALIMDHIGMKNWSWIISLGAIAGITSALILSLYGQSRVQWSMANRGLVPAKMAEIDPRYGTPSNAIYVWGAIAAVVAGLFPISELSELTNIGTLAAFIIVQIGIVVLRFTEPKRERAFRCPSLTSPLVTFYVRNLWFAVLVAAGTGFAMIQWLPPGITLARNFLANALVNNSAAGFAPAVFKLANIAHYAVMPAAVLTAIGLIVLPLRVKNRSQFSCSWLPDMPIVGSLCCAAFMAALPALTWYRFIGWMVIGAVVYFCFSFHHSKLNGRSTAAR